MKDMFRICFAFFRIAAVLLCLGLVPLAAKTNPREQQGILPITTKSWPERQVLGGGLVKMQNLDGPEGMQDFRKAVVLDPDFAMANIMISFTSVDPTVDPAEQVSARDKANVARSKVSHGEQLVIDWLTNSSEGNMIPAIQAMNEILNEYQNDKILAWLGAVCVENQQELTSAIPMFEPAI